MFNWVGGGDQQLVIAENKVGKLSKAMFLVFCLWDWFVSFQWISLKVLIYGKIILNFNLFDFSLETWSLVVILSVALGKRRWVEVQVVLKQISDKRTGVGLICTKMKRMHSFLAKFILGMQEKHTQLPGQVISFLRFK